MGYVVCSLVVICSLHETEAIEVHFREKIYVYCVKAYVWIRRHRTRKKNWMWEKIAKPYDLNFVEAIITSETHILTIVISIKIILVLTEALQQEGNSSNIF